MLNMYMEQAPHKGQAVAPAQPRTAYLRMLLQLFIQNLRNFNVFLVFYLRN